MRILRVFPRRTSFTPTDDLVDIGYPGLWRPQVDEVHISCLFTWDREYCEQLKKQWSEYYRVVRIGGPGYCSLINNEFVPGRYVKKGVVFTSRGCNFKCSWCLVPKIEGKFRALNEIAIGNVIQDNNILLASKNHLRKVFLMLTTQRAIRFLGGLDVRLLTDWHIEQLRDLHIKEVWLAFDSWDKQSRFKIAVEKLGKAGFKRSQIRCYVLAGFEEPIQESEGRLRLAYEYGALPFIQVYRSASWHFLNDGTLRHISDQDRKFIRKWSRPAIIKSIMAT